MEIDMKYDDFFMQILEDKKSIVGFLETIFSFLARRTDFYYESKREGDNLGFLPGVKEKIVQQVMRSCDPTRPAIRINETKCQSHQTNLSTPVANASVETESVPPVANEVCIEADTRQTEVPSNRTKHKTNNSFQPNEYYNGACYENYAWSQSITDIELHILLPQHISSSKQLNVSITSDLVCVRDKVNPKEIIFDGKLAVRCRGSEAVWSISNRKLQITLEKVQEIWWDKLLGREPALDLSRMDCSRPLEELPEESQAAIEKMRWDQQQKALGLPTSEDLKNEQLLKQAWDADGSPFKGQPFDPSIVKFN